MKSQPTIISLIMSNSESLAEELTKKMHPSSDRRQKERKKTTGNFLLSFSSKIHSRCLLLSLIALTLLATCAASGPTQTGSSASNATSSQATGSGDATAKQAATSQKVTIIDPQQQQSTELSSMYVQIPIAESAETSGQEAAAAGGQQQISSEDGSSVSTSGSWPKKFQIGYIRQSDLHQVLIESLKNDPFVSLQQSPSTSATGATKSTATSQLPTSVGPTPAPATKSLATKSAAASGQAPASDNASLMGQSVATSVWPAAFGQQPATAQMAQYLSRLQQPQLPMTKNSYRGASGQHQAPVAGFREHNGKMLHHKQHQQQHQQQFNQQQMLRYQQQLAASLNQHPAGGQRHFGQQPKAGHYLPQQQQQQQFQFAGYPSSMLQNQPIYTINGNNNYQAQQQQQEQLDLSAMLLMQNQQQQQQQLQYPGPTLQRAPKSTGDYYSSWKPVTSDKQQPSIPGNQQQQQQQTQAVDYQGMNDDFEDGFTSPSKDASGSSAAAQSNMNRHPVLSSYLSSSAGQNQVEQSLSKVVSPAMQAKMQLQKQEQGTKSGVKGAAATKGGSGGATKGSTGQEAAAGTKRRASESTTSGSTTTTTASSTTSGTSGTDSTQQTSTMSSVDADEGSNSTTTTTTPSSSSSSNTTTAQMETTTRAPVTTTGSSLITSTTTLVEADTAEPDSEVIDSDTTEPPTGTSGGVTTSTAATTTTTASASAAAAMTRNGSSTPASSTSGDESAEVATGQDAGQQQIGRLPSLAADGSERTREETTPATGSSDAIGASPAKGQSAEVEGGGQQQQVRRAAPSRQRAATDGATMSDEALLAAAVRTGAEIGKTLAKSQVKQQQSQAKKTRSSQSTGSSERLVQAAASSSQAARNRKSTGSSSSGKQQLITKKQPAPSGRSAKQVDLSASSGVKGAKSPATGATKSSALKAGRGATGSGSKSQKKRVAGSGSTKQLKQAADKSQVKVQKSTRMATAAQSDRLQLENPNQQQPGSGNERQVLSMSAAQAQSTAQTLASLLLSRCLSSANCAHLLDVCSTKQAAVQWPAASPQQPSSAAESQADPAANGNSSSLAGWSLPVGLMSSSLMGMARALGADRALRLFPQWREAVESVMDQSPQTGYTLVLPSNEAADRLPLQTVDSWLSSPELLVQIIDNHMLDSPELVAVGFPQENDSSSSNSQLNPGPRGQSRYMGSKGWQLNQHRDRMLTINGKRVVYANQAAPSNGRIHVIDGIFDWTAGLSGSTSTLSPSSSQAPSSMVAVGSTGSSQAKLMDIMDTLKQCDKFDGFVTLAEGTGLTQILKQDGPMTVFVPSNEALRKIPDDELEVIKNNSTALKEFLMYHVVNGSYFSQDLRDGQQLASILDMRPIQVGVRVDGCSRRLVEANTSPMRRPDIVAKNGVIHILDWYLTTRDNEWCDQSSHRQSALDSGSGASSERLQQLASDSSYATRMPANHKPLPSKGVSSGDQEQAAISSFPLPANNQLAATATNYEVNNVAVAQASPLNSNSNQQATIINRAAA